MAAIQSKTWNGRKIAKEVVFEKGQITEDVPFVALNKAIQYLKMSGYAYGSMCRNEPIGIALSEKCSEIAKWKNLDEKDKKELAGFMVGFPDFRNGDVKIIFFE